MTDIPPIPENTAFEMDEPTQQFWCDNIMIGVFAAEETGACVTFRFKAGPAEPEFVLRLGERSLAELQTIRDAVQTFLAAMGGARPN